MKLGSGVVLVSVIDGEEILFSEKAACVYCGISLPEIAPRTFSFNSPHGACPTCTGLGTQMEIDAELIVTHPELSLQQGAIAPWSKVVNGSQWHASILEALAKKYDFSLDTPWRELDEDQRQKVLYGAPEPLTIRYTPQHGNTRNYTINFEGVIPNLDRRYKQTESEGVREEIESLYVGPHLPGLSWRASQAGSTGGNGWWTQHRAGHAPLDCTGATFLPGVGRCKRRSTHDQLYICRCSMGMAKKKNGNGNPVKRDPLAKIDPERTTGAGDIN